MKLLNQIKSFRKLFQILNFKTILNKNVVYNNFKTLKTAALRSSLLGIGSLGFGSVMVVSLWYLEQRHSTVKCARLENSHSNPSDSCLQDAIKQSRILIDRMKLEYNCPAITITVTVDGKEVWKEGLGIADVENNIPCTPNTIMRIASISKPITMAVVAKLVETNSLDLDENIRHYLPEWPEKTFGGKEAKITTRMLISMLGGIRSYDKSCGVKKDDTKPKDEFDNKEYYLKKPYKSVMESLTVFMNDDLCSMPGTAYLYSTYSWTLVSAVVEKVAKKKFELVLKSFFKELNLDNTYLDENLPLIPKRARYYVVRAGRLQNAPYVDNSYKWAGGGLLSTSSDLCKFGNTMLACFQGVGIEDDQDTNIKTITTIDNKEIVIKSNNDNSFTPYLSKKTMEMIWQPVVHAKSSTDAYGFYAMGWESIPTRPQLSISPTHTNHFNRRFFCHTGGAIGASSILLVMPRDVAELNSETPATKSHNSGTEVEAEHENAVANKKSALINPQGTVVAIITNMQYISMKRIALEIAAIFEAAVEKDHNKDQTGDVIDDSSKGVVTTTIQ